MTVCDLSNGGFACEATAVVGPAGRVFYVSPESVYVWMSDWMRPGDQARTQSLLYRLPLDGSAPSALQVSGSPVDQFWFLEGEDGQLNVLMRADAAGDGMWRAEVAAGDVALMRVTLASFTDGSEPVPAAGYRALPTPAGYTFQNRFVSDYLLYGTGSGWGAPQNAKHSVLYAVRWAGGDTRELALEHGVDRVEVMGTDAVVVGTDGTDGKDLHFTAVRLGESPEIASRYTRSDARKVNCAVTASSTGPKDLRRAFLACRSACPVVRVIAISLKRRPTSCFCGTSRCTSSKLANSAPGQNERSMILVALHASIGTAMPARSSSGVGSSPFWDTNSWKDR